MVENILNLFTCCFPRNISNLRAKLLQKIHNKGLTKSPAYRSTSCTSCSFKFEVSEHPDCLHNNKRLDNTGVEGHLQNVGTPLVMAGNTESVNCGEKSPSSTSVDPAPVTTKGVSNPCLEELRETEPAADGQILATPSPSDIGAVSACNGTSGQHDTYPDDTAVHNELTLSIVSDDTNYSEDYTRMTEVEDQSSLSPTNLNKDRDLLDFVGEDDTRSFDSEIGSIGTLDPDSGQINELSKAVHQLVVSVSSDSETELGMHSPSEENDPSTPINSPTKNQGEPNSKLTGEDTVEKDTTTQDSAEDVKFDLEFPPSPTRNTCTTELSTVSLSDIKEKLSFSAPQFANLDLSPDKGPSSAYDVTEFDYLHTEPIRRSTSLKTYKTPPGTPHRKKEVRFADALGLDLESVRHILNTDAPPTIPSSATKHLNLKEEQKALDCCRYFALCFSQPGAACGFLQRVLSQKVVLENCLVNDADYLVVGTIRVANVAYHKKVVVRFSTNHWVTHEDIPASYVLKSSEAGTDRFSFTLSIPRYFGVGSRLEFCVMYSAGGQTFWDSNYNANYGIECYARLPMTGSDNMWLSFL